MSSIVTIYNDIDVEASDAGYIDIAALTIDTRLYNLPCTDWIDLLNPALLQNFGSDSQGTGSNAQWVGRKTGSIFKPRSDTGPYVKANAFGSLSSAHFDESGRNGELICVDKDYWGADGASSVSIVWVGRGVSGSNSALLASGDPTNFSAIRHNSGGFVTYEAQHGSGALLSSGITYPDTSPHTGIVSLDRTANEAVMRVNGAEVARATSVSVWPLSGARLHIGGAGSGDAATGNGSQQLTLRGEMFFVMAFPVALHRAENAAILTQLETDLRTRYGTW